MKKEMLINVLQPEECRIAIMEDGVLEELYVERTSHESYVGNIYKGRIVNIEPSIQAAFVDFGVGRNGFLHVSDVDPQYYRHLVGPADRDREFRSGGRWEEPAPGRREPRPPEESFEEPIERPFDSEPPEQVPSDDQAAVQRQEEAEARADAAEAAGFGAGIDLDAEPRH